jgi:hypothetical protein
LLRRPRFTQGCNAERMDGVDKFQVLSTVPWLRRLVSGLSTQRPGFELRTVHMRCVVYTIALGEVPMRVLWFIPVSMIAPLLRTPFFCCYKTNGQSLGTLQKRYASSKVGEHLTEKCFHLQAALKRHNEKTPCMPGHIFKC